jgi:hypothetical protein
MSAFVIIWQRRVFVEQRPSVYATREHSAASCERRWGQGYDVDSLNLQGWLEDLPSTPLCSRRRRPRQARALTGPPSTTTTADLTSLTCECQSHHPPIRSARLRRRILVYRTALRTHPFEPALPSLRVACLHQALPHIRDRIDREASQHYTLLSALRSLGTRLDIRPFAASTTPLYHAHALTIDAWRSRTTTTSRNGGRLTLHPSREIRIA